MDLIIVLTSKSSQIINTWNFTYRIHKYLLCNFLIIDKVNYKILGFKNKYEDNN